jgi:Zn2+/Cd2+-exporting ATPase
LSIAERVKPHTLFLSDARGLKAVFLPTTIVRLTGLWIAILAETGATVLVTLKALRLLRTRDAA